MSSHERIESSSTKDQDSRRDYVLRAKLAKRFTIRGVWHFPPADVDPAKHQEQMGRFRELQRQLGNKCVAKSIPPSRIARNDVPIEEQQVIMTYVDYGSPTYE